METQETNSQISASVIRAYLMYALVVKISYHDQEIESRAGITKNPIMVRVNFKKTWPYKNPYICIKNIKIKCI